MNLSHVVMTPLVTPDTPDIHHRSPAPPAWTRAQAAVKDELFSQIVGTHVLEIGVGTGRAHAAPLPSTST